MLNIQEIIENAYADLEHLKHPDSELIEAVNIAINTLDCGGVRVAEKVGNDWMINEWMKKAILLYFKLNSSKLIDAGYATFHDKVDLKFNHYNLDMFQKEQIRVVPGAIVRKGAFIGRNTVLMPSFVNIGAYVGDGSMVDTWATVGSCAQVGSNVHLSGGVGIGGVLEPLQAKPTIIEDDCFIGARSEIVEGVIVGRGSVISMGVFISQSTKIYDRETGDIMYGRVPEYSVVVPGSVPSKDKTHSTYAAIIVKKVDARTRAKVSVNDILRD
ncbi:MAG: 2,3,4,5-tetrahydropyridine-2,6-dicarboxylate N-succinyltransferase [Neisseriaceae bacterium]